jgi:hypothetical protein
MRELYEIHDTTVQPNIPCPASPIAQSRSRSRGFSFSFSGDRPRERERERERERFRSRDLSSLRSSGPPAPAAAFSRSAFIWAIWSLRSAELGLGARRQFGSRPRSPRSRDRERSRPPLLPHCFFWASNRWRMSLRKQPITVAACAVRARSGMLTDETQASSVESCSDRHDCTLPRRNCGNVPRGSPSLRTRTTRDQGFDVFSQCGG